MKLRYLDDKCKNGPCPTLWETERDTYVVQGFVVDDHEAIAQMQLPSNETAVEVPKDLILDLARRILEDTKA